MTEKMKREIQRVLMEQGPNPYVMRMKRLRADDEQAYFWERFRKLEEEQGMVPDWLCHCKRVVI